jgi:hypothetical protein
VCGRAEAGPCRFLRDVLGLKLCRGQLAKIVAKAAGAMGPAYQELAARLPAEAYLNVDETGHKENASRPWTWVFRARLFTLFKIAPSRGADVLVEMLGEEFNGVLAATTSRPTTSTWTTSTSWCSSAWPTSSAT